MTFLSLPLAWWGQLALFFAILLIAMKPLGLYMARVFSGERTFLTPLMQPLENAIYKLGGIDPKEEMGWSAYAKSFLIFSFAEGLFLFLALLEQGSPSIDPHLALNLTISFLTGTDWQAVAPEISITPMTQMTSLAVHNFLAAATSLALAIALTRSLARSDAQTIGNLWVDITRGVLYILLPLCFLFSLFLVSQGVVQTFGETVSVTALEPENAEHLVTGPVASQVAIKQIGTNGGGYYNANAAHPFENPTPLSHFTQLLAMLLLPIALLYAFGVMIHDKRQSFAILASTLLLLLPLAFLIAAAEQSGNPLLNVMGVDQTLGNLEGKELRTGTTGASLWTTMTTATATGSVDSALNAFLPTATGVALVLMQLGEVLFGGVGSGLYSMLVYVLLTVFLAGLMIGRTPEYLGKTVGVFDMKMISLVILLPALTTLLGTALSVTTAAGQAGMTGSQAQGLTQALYAFSSASNNNGSALNGLNAASPFYTLLLSLCMIAGRLGIGVAVLALAGSLAPKKATPVTKRFLDTTTPLFIVMLSLCLLMATLPYLPSLTLSATYEHFHLMAGN